MDLKFYLYLIQELHKDCEIPNDLTPFEANSFLQNKIKELQEEKEKKLMELQELTEKDKVDITSGCFTCEEENCCTWLESSQLNPHRFTDVKYYTNRDVLLQGCSSHVYDLNVGENLDS